MTDSSSDPRVFSKDWRAIVEPATEFLSLIDQDLKIVYVNHAQDYARDYYGLSVFEFVSPKYHDTLRNAVANAVEHGLPQHFDSDATGVEGGLSRYSNWVFRIAGDSGLFAFVATDITHTNRVEEKLELSESTLRSIVENSPDAIVVVNADREVIFSNRWEHGMDPDKVIGVKAESTVAEADRPNVINAIKHVLATGETTSYESTLEAPGITPRFSVRAAPISVSGEVSRVMLVATDITEKRRLEQERSQLAEQLHQAQKMESLGQLTGGIAHDFNNLLTIIGGNLDLALNSNPLPPEKLENYLTDALKAVERGSSLIQQLLAYSRKQALQPEVLDMEALLDEIDSILSRSLGETIEVSVQSDPELWHCFADKGQLENALINMAVNAKDAMPRGGKLHVNASNYTAGSADHALAPGEYVRIRVEDSGTGIDGDDLPKVFEPFFTTKDVNEGSGLGLSMVQGFAQQSGGDVRIHSVLGEGTSVELFVPRGIDNTHAEWAVATKNHLPRGNGELILVVEDDPQLSALAEDMLELLGYKSLSAASAHEALTILKSRANTVSLLLSDVVLPAGVNGFELATQAREINPELRVVFASGYSSDTLLSQPEGAALGELMQKPYSLEQLANTIKANLI